MSDIIQTASWADFGYRRLGDLPEDGSGLTAAQVAERLLQHGDYETTPDCWARRRARKRGTRFPASLEIVDVLDRETALDNDRLAFIERHASSKWVRVERGHVQFRADLNGLAEGVKGAETFEDRWRGMYRLSQALFYAGPEWLGMMLRQHVAPTFFRLYPNGKIVVLRYDTGVDEAAAIQRCLYAFAQTPLPNLVQGGFEGIQTLLKWHSGSLTGLVPRLLNLFFSLFYPFVGGACGGPVGLVFVFLFDPPEQHTLLPFPRNWLAFASQSASFGKEEADIMEMVQNLNGPAHQRASHQRYQHAQGFTVAERLSFLHWYIARLNRLLYELTDACNFPKGGDPEVAVDPVFGYEHRLTVDRLMRKTLLAMSLDDAPTGDLMGFEVADLYDGLSERFRNCKADGVRFQKTEFFKTLFDTQEAPALLVPRLVQLPQPFGAYFTDLATEAYRKIEETVIGSVWPSSKVQQGGVLVRNEDLSKEVLMPAPKSWAKSCGPTGMPTTVTSLPTRNRRTALRGSCSWWTATCRSR
jgi:hypothetical protein